MERFYLSEGQLVIAEVVRSQAELGPSLRQSNLQHVAVPGGRGAAFLSLPSSAW